MGRLARTVSVPACIGDDQNVASKVSTSTKVSSPAWLCEDEKEEEKGVFLWLSLFQNTVKGSVVFFFLEQSHARVGSVEHVINESTLDGTRTSWHDVC